MGVEGGSLPSEQRSSQEGGVRPFKNAIVERRESALKRKDMGDFASGREFAAFLGLTPRQSSTGGKPRLARVIKMGDRYLRNCWSWAPLDAQPPQRP